MNTKKIFVVGVAAVLSVVIAGLEKSDISAFAGPRVIKITATEDYAFVIEGSKKPIINAAPGEVLELEITAQKADVADSDGAVHSLTIRELKDKSWNIKLYEGTKTYILLAPEEPGEYVLECVVWCGQGHFDMRGKLIVK